MLTGEWALRKAAKEENVSVMGTIGILDIIESMIFELNQEVFCWIVRLRRSVTD